MASVHGLGVIAANRHAVPAPPLSTLSGYRDEFDAANAGSITSSGSSVSAWASLSGSGRSLVQATSARQPQTGTATQKGRNVLEFTSTSNHWMATAAFTAITQPITIYVVAKITSTTTGDRQAFFDGIASGNRNACYINSFGGSRRWAAYSGSAEVGNVPAANADTAWHIHTRVFNGSSTELWTDSNQILTGVSPGTDGLTGYTIGNLFSVGTGGPLGGAIAHIAVFTGAHDLVTQSLARARLREQWGTP